MNFCKYCGREIKDNEICECETSKSGATIVDEILSNNKTATEYETKNGKIFAVLSYIGILWIVGMLVEPEKDDPKVKFHVGQGIILTILSAGLNIAQKILGFILPDFLDVILGLAVTVVSVALLVIGVINAYNGTDNELPIVGQFSFYK